MFYSWQMSWEERSKPPNAQGPSPRPPRKLTDYDFSPESFQNWLLDMANLSTTHANVGSSTDPEKSPVGNWLRGQGLRIIFSSVEGKYYVLTSEGEELGNPPEYLARYLDLLAEDPFPGLGVKNDVPAYQALALLTYVITTERYYSP